MWESIHDLVLDFHKQQPNMEEDEADLLWKNLMNIIDDMRNMNEDVANDDYFEDLSYNFDSNDVECEKVLLDIDRLIEEKITSDKTTENKHHKLRFWKMHFDITIVKFHMKSFKVFFPNLLNPFPCKV